MARKAKQKQHERHKRRRRRPYLVARLGRSGKPYLATPSRFGKDLGLGDDGFIYRDKKRTSTHWYVVVNHSFEPREFEVVRRDKLNDPVMLERIRWRAICHGQEFTLARYNASVERVRRAEAPRYENDEGKVVRVLFADNRSSPYEEEEVTKRPTCPIERISRLRTETEDWLAAEAWHRSYAHLDDTWSRISITERALQASLDNYVRRRLSHLYELPAHDRPTIRFMINGRPFIFDGERGMLGWPHYHDILIDLNAARLQSPAPMVVHYPFRSGRRSTRPIQP